MATRKSKASDGQAEARALIDLPAFGVKSGELLVAEALTIAALVADGSADSHPDAVAYAKALQEH